MFATKKKLKGFKKGSMFTFKLSSGANVVQGHAAYLLLSDMFPVAAAERLTLAHPMAKVVLNEMR